MNNVEQFVGVKKITGIDRQGNILIDLVDGTTIKMAFIEKATIFTYPAFVTGVAVHENGILMGFNLRR